ncbi:SigE family RNA polymerase sigma factor [Actinocorallia sp. API 0066]|uniref:RNA polymerase sigma factor n=1 Tax=Actinocorallia sp. API 0066 TaxID=2896846 RepID=UPI001E59783E|nr:SigE family RNA polymerase sigma factor [Actinocorallia sp. API 0066]MCD0451108.1 SigE family RNA polymerase sigma factor [Actinocorallia sp. API 0066]
MIRWPAAIADRDALPAFYREHQTGLVRLAVMLVGDEATAEDVVQDVFVRLHRERPALRDEGKLLAYTRAAVLNGCRSVLRRRKLAHRHAERHLPPVWSAEAAAMLGEDHREVMRALHRLPRRKREVLVLRYYADLPDAEIAVVLRIRPSTVRSTMSRALAALERELEATR